MRPDDDDASGPFDSDESTKLLAPRQLARPATQSPPIPTARSRNPSPPPFTSPGTVHERAGVPGLPPRRQEDPTIDEQPSISMTPQAPSLPPPPMMPPNMQGMPMMPPNMTGMPIGGMPPAMPPNLTGMPTGGMPPGMQPNLGMPTAPNMGPGFPPTPRPGTAQDTAQLQPGYPMWGAQPQLPPRGASPTAPDLYDRPVYPQRPSVPVIGFERGKRETSVKTWVLIVGAVLMAAVAFAITRLFLT
jgi:hypothetical protein